jgi:hypothetical protein
LLINPILIDPKNPQTIKRVELDGKKVPPVFENEKPKDRPEHAVTGTQLFSKNMKKALDINHQYAMITIVSER